MCIHTSVAYRVQRSFGRQCRVDARMPVREQLQVLPKQEHARHTTRGMTNHTVGFCWCCCVEAMVEACWPFALLVAPFFTSAVAPQARPRHHALGGTSLAPSPVHSFELANLQDDSKRPPLPVFHCGLGLPARGGQATLTRPYRPHSLREGIRGVCGSCTVRNR